jgi:hypothetical protein
MEENSSIDVLVRYQEDEVIVLELIVSSTVRRSTTSSP